MAVITAENLAESAKLNLRHKEERKRLLKNHAQQWKGLWEELLRQSASPEEAFRIVARVAAAELAD